MLHKLNEDCWLSVLKYVGLPEKLALATICESLHNLVKYQWTQVKDVTYDRQFLELFKQQPGQLDDFLQCASKSLQRMVLRDPTLDSLRSYSFPNMRSLDWDQLYENEETADEIVLVLTQLFPNLTKLTMHSGATGLYLTRWSQLQELHVTTCEFLETSTFPEIFDTLPLRKITLIDGSCDNLLDKDIILVSKCATLEELVINDYHVSEYSLLSNLMQLPRFRCLVIDSQENFNSVFQELATSHPLRVKSLLFNENMNVMSAPIDLILRMKNLRRLVLVNRYSVAKQYFKVCTKLQNLEELHLVNVTNFPNTAQLWELAEKRSLNLINLSGCHIDKTSFQLGILILNRILGKRFSPLTLNLHNTKLPHNSELIIEAMKKHQNLKICFKPIDFNVREYKFTEIQFYTNKD